MTSSVNGRIRASCLGLILGSIGNSALAATGTSTAVDCLPTIEHVCADLPDHLETCLAQRAAQLDPACRDFLKNAMAQAREPSGTGACLEDIKHVCAGLTTTNAIMQCLTERRKEFSPACQKYLDTPIAGADNS